MFKTPSNLNLANITRSPANVMTRSMARANVNIPMRNLPQQNRGFANPAFNETNFGGSVERLQVQPPLRGMQARGGSSNNSIFASD